MTPLDACLWRGVGFERVVPPSSPTFVSIFWLQARGACTKHLSGISIGALLPLRVPETRRFPRSSSQIRAGSLSSWLRARARGRARRRNALRRPTHVRRGGGCPIKATGCRAGSRRPSRASPPERRSQIFGSLSGLMKLASPWVPWEPAPVRRRAQPPPLH